MDDVANNLKNEKIATTMQPDEEGYANVPAFLAKLWQMVCDPNTDELICWAKSNKSFIIQNRAEFWYKLLPTYYKHNNMSSFVRQLNMYGFNKISSENCSKNADKDEIQFFHPYFKKDSPKLLKLIKRKVTMNKNSETTSQILKSEDLTQVLKDVKYLRAKQVNADSQLAAMKQENAVLWRELAMLRQKHSKQQQIVNKLIQFLVSIVHPNNRMGVGVKRRYHPLMLQESPTKKSKSKQRSSKKQEGPTIHELDSELDIGSDKLFEAEGIVEMNSPQTSSLGDMERVSSPLSKSDILHQALGNEKLPEGTEDSQLEYPELGYPDLLYPGAEWEKSKDDLPPFEDCEDQQLQESADVVELLLDDVITEPIISSGSETKGPTPDVADKVFLNPSTQDTLLSNLSKGNYNLSILNSDKKGTSSEDIKEKSSFTPDQMTVATRKPDSKYCENFDLHIENTQSQIDQLKEILHGCNALDANALLGLFNEDYPDYGLPFSQDTGQQQDAGGPLSSGSELTPYGLVQFEQLFDDSVEPIEESIPTDLLDDDDLELNTPQIEDMKAEFLLNSPKQLH